MSGPDRSLRPRELDPLDPGDVQPRGWLRRQLTVQAEGLTGSLEEFWPPLSDNEWLGGAHDGWERGPYYADGLVPLAALLDDPSLSAAADRWIEAFLDRTEDGWIGPAPDENGEDGGLPGDVWPRFVVLKVLRSHYEATGDERAIEAMLDFCDLLVDSLDDLELASWARYRWGDLVASLHWLYERTGDEGLLDVAAAVADRGYDWTVHFQDDHLDGFAYDRPVAREDADMATHGVNNAMGLKAPGVWFRQSGDDRDLTAVADGLAHLDRFHGQATGVFAADEHLAGKDPTRGTELCTVVETMHSLEELLSVTGDPTLGDRLERIAYNALPAAFAREMCVHQYDQQVNQVLCTVADRGWTNGAEANVFGVAPHFGCCTANYHQGWPKLASHCWMERDDGLATVAYAPCEVETTVDGTTVVVTEETAYPFDDSASIAVDPDEPVRFPLSLRVPEWARNAAITPPDGSVRRPEPGTYSTIDREWDAGDTVDVDFGMGVRAERRRQGAVALHRGPLVFAYAPPVSWKRIGGDPPHADWECYPDGAWNYGLRVDPAAPDESVSVAYQGPGETPFASEAPPVHLRVEGAQVPEWRLAGGDAGPIPRSPIETDAEPTDLDLVPYGCTTLRVTEFPLLRADPDETR